LRIVVSPILVLLLTNCEPVTQLSAPSPAAVTSTQALTDNAQELYKSPHDLVLGNPAGQIAIVEFFDYNCGYCKREVAEVKKLIQSDSDVRVVIKEFPILGKGSLFAAKAALASARQGRYREFHLALSKIHAAATEHTVLAVARDTGLNVDKLRTDMESPDIADAIRRNKAMAKALAINGTPAFVFDSAVKPHYVTFKVLSQHVARIRENGGCKVC
jgi:protein-disulfide isomerase